MALKGWSRQITYRRN